MAVVRITERLIKEVCSKYSAANRKHDEKAYPDEWFDMLYNIIVPKHVYDILAQLPQDYTMQHLELRVVYNGRHFALCRPNNTTKFYHIVHALSPDVAEGGHSYGYIKPKIDNPVWREFLNLLGEYVAAQDAAKNKLIAQEKAIEAKLRSYSSLAPALVDNPGLWHMLPDWAKEQHALKKERRSRTERKLPAVSEEVDVVFNTALAVTLSKKIGE